MHNNHKNLILVAVLSMGGQSFAQQPAPKQASAPSRAPSAAAALKPCTSVVVDPVSYVTLGKSSLIKLSAPAARMVVGGQASTRAGEPVPVGDKTTAAAPASAQAASNGVADVEITLLSPTELFFLGKKSGAMNVILQGADGRCVIKDIIVTVDPGTLQAKLSELMPEETGIKVKSAENTIVLTGKVSDALKLDEAMSLATAYGDGKKVVNMLRITTPQQVMLEVTIAEVSKNLLEKFGANLGLTKSYSGGVNTYSLLSNFLSNGGGLLQALRIGRGSLKLDGQTDDGLVRVLAEPNIMAITGQQASFLSGGKIYIPVAQSKDAGGSNVTLEEKEFGIGVKFTPTVLDGTRINLKMVSEVSDLSQTGSPFTTLGGVTAVLPSLTVRRADTTVQLNDGQSFVIAGLIKNNFTETIKRFPGLGEVPVVGALFRSTEFQNNQTELLFVITPRLVKPLTETPRLPTDNHVIPSRSDVILHGRMEGSAPVKAPEPQPATAPAVSSPAAPAIK